MDNEWTVFIMYIDLWDKEFFVILDFVKAVQPDSVSETSDNILENWVLERILINVRIKPYAHEWRMKKGIIVRGERQRCSLYPVLVVYTEIKLKEIKRDVIPHI